MLSPSLKAYSAMVFTPLTKLDFNAKVSELIITLHHYSLESDEKMNFYDLYQL
jgi:hypothetical protein